MVQAVIFDMDGVLFDTEDFYYKRRERFLNSRGISISHLPPNYFIGGNMKQVWHAILGDDYDKWDVTQLQTAYSQDKEDNPLPYKDLIFDSVKPVLQTLKEKNILMGVASSSTKSDIMKALTETEIRDYFQVVLSGHDFPESKPDPAIYSEAARQLGVPKSDILIVEDSQKGIAAGVAAGIEVWAIKDHRFNLDQSQASHWIEDLGDILPLF